jgi:hypothetical protein
MSYSGCFVGLRLNVERLAFGLKNPDEVGLLRTKDLDGVELLPMKNPPSIDSSPPLLR